MDTQEVKKFLLEIADSIRSNDLDIQWNLEAALIMLDEGHISFARQHIQAALRKMQKPVEV